MRHAALMTLATLALGAGACGKTAPCDQLTERLCATSPAHCVEARPWIDAQAAGGPADVACEHVLADASAMAAYAARFADEMTPRPATTSPSKPAPSGPATTSRPAAKPTTKDQVREVGATIEEIGKAGEKAGEAIDKLDDAFKRGDAK